MWKMFRDAHYTSIKSKMGFWIEKYENNVQGD
jgi:hypothetical protein